MRKKLGKTGKKNPKISAALRGNKNAANSKVGGTMRVVGMGAAGATKVVGRGMVNTARIAMKAKASLDNRAIRKAEVDKAKDYNRASKAWRKGGDLSRGRLF